MAKTKISKVAKDINVALPTVVEFLRKKGITVEDNPNARIDDDVYDLLVKEYAPDKAVKSQAAQVLSERQKEKVKPATPEPADTKPAAPKPAPGLKLSLIHISEPTRRS